MSAERSFAKEIIQLHLSEGETHAHAHAKALSDRPA